MYSTLSNNRFLAAFKLHAVVAQRAIQSLRRVLFRLRHHCELHRREANRPDLRIFVRTIKVEAEKESFDVNACKFCIKHRPTFGSSMRKCKGKILRYPASEGSEVEATAWKMTASWHMSEEMREMKTSDRTCRVKLKAVVYCNMEFGLVQVWPWQPRSVLLYPMHRILHSNLHSKVRPLQIDTTEYTAS